MPLGSGWRRRRSGCPCSWPSSKTSANRTRQERKPGPVPRHRQPEADAGPETVEHFEGCLSVEGFQAIVPRARTVHVDALDHQGKPISIDATGWYARILQHEIDHLNGTLYIDRMHTRTFSTARNMQYWAGAKVEDVLAALERPAS